MLDEALLISSIRAGDASAFTAVVERYQAPIARYLRRLVADQALVEDLTQETSLSAYRAIRKTDSDLAFKPWLYRIATNHARMHFRRQRLLRFLPVLAERHGSAVPPSGEALGEQDLVRRALARRKRWEAAATGVGGLRARRGVAAAGAARHGAGAATGRGGVARRAGSRRRAPLPDGRGSGVFPDGAAVYVVGSDRFAVMPVADDGAPAEVHRVRGLTPVAALAATGDRIFRRLAESLRLSDIPVRSVQIPR